jgi:hypothetical protein
VEGQQGARGHVCGQMKDRGGVSWKLIGMCAAVCIRERYVHIFEGRIPWPSFALPGLRLYGLWVAEGRGRGRRRWWWAGRLAIHSCDRSELYTKMSQIPCVSQETAIEA